MNTERLTETLYVRADRLCLGDRVVLGVGRSMVVESMTLVGDDVNVNGDSLMTSQGNVLKVKRTVMPTDFGRYQP